jgi:hypothetical protein
MKTFFLGANDTIQDRWICKVRSMGWDLEKIGGVDNEATPQSISVPNDTEVIVVMKDHVSHKVRDKFKLIYEDSGTLFLELSSKVSKAMSGLYAHEEVISRLWKTPDALEEEGSKEAFGSLNNNNELLVTTLDEAWNVFRWNRNFSGSTKKLAKSWIKHCRENEVTFKFYYAGDKDPVYREGEDLLPSLSKLKLCKNPLLEISNKIKKDKEVSKLYATHWIMGASDEGYIFNSKNEIDRALKMTFGCTSRDIDEIFWSELLEKKVIKEKVTKEKVLAWEVKHPSISHTKNEILLNGIEVVSEDLLLNTDDIKLFISTLQSLSLKGSFIVHVSSTEKDHSILIKKQQVDQKCRLQYVDELFGIRDMYLTNTLFIYKCKGPVLDQESFSENDPMRPKIRATTFSTQKAVYKVL